MGINDLGNGDDLPVIETTIIGGKNVKIIIDAGINVNPEISKNIGDSIGEIDCKLAVETIISNMIPENFKKIDTFSGKNILSQETIDLAKDIYDRISNESSSTNNSDA